MQAQFYVCGQKFSKGKLAGFFFFFNYYLFLFFSSHNNGRWRLIYIHRASQAETRKSPPLSTQQQQRDTRQKLGKGLSPRAFPHVPYLNWERREGELNSLGCSFRLLVAFCGPAPVCRPMVKYHSVSAYRTVLAFSFRRDTMHPKGPRIVCSKYTCQVFS